MSSYQTTGLPPYPIFGHVFTTDFYKVFENEVMVGGFGFLVRNPEAPNT